MVLTSNFPMQLSLVSEQECQERDGATQQKDVAVSCELTLSDNTTAMTHRQLNHFQEEGPTGQLLIVVL